MDQLSRTLGWIAIPWAIVAWCAPLLLEWIGGWGGGIICAWPFFMLGAACASLRGAYRAEGEPRVLARLSLVLHGVFFFSTCVILIVRRIVANSPW